MSHLVYVGLGNKLQRQKKGPWSLGKRMTERTCLGKEDGKRHRLAQEEERACPRSSILRVFICLLRWGSECH